MRIIESRSIDNQAGLLGSKLITGTSVIEGAFQSFIVAENTVVTKVYNSIGIDVTGRLGLTSITLKAGAFISMPKNDYFSSIKLTSGSVVAYFVSHGGMTITAQAYLNEFLARVGSSYLEAEDCVKNHLQQLINIGLLQKASLVMSPSMYEEDLVKSVVPQDASGDLSFTRASDGTRVNSAGLVEVVPWNLVGNSENFSVDFIPINSSISNNTTTAPNGTTTADSLIENTATDNHFAFADSTQLTGTQYTYSVYAKSIGGRNIKVFGSSGFSGDVIVDLANGSVLSGSGVVESVGNGWYRISITGTTTTTTVRAIVYIANGTSFSYTGNGTSGVFLWGAQLNIGSTAKPYFPTTDRLNVPRLTYQNGGGGCPSLLLEPQRTNVRSYSEDIMVSNLYSATNSTLTSVSITNPQNTSSANLFKLNSGANTGNNTDGFYFGSSITLTNSTKHTQSIFVKAFGTNTLRIRSNVSGLIADFTLSGNGTAPTISGVLEGATIELMTNGWYRCTWTFTTTTSAPGNRADAWALKTDVANGTDGLYIWGAQLEESSYPTTYIPTTSATATRVVDSFSRNNIFTNGLITSSGGTWFVSLLNNVVMARDTNEIGLFIGNSSTGVTGDCLLIRNNGSNTRLIINKRIAGTQTAIYNTTTDTTKLAIKWNGTTADVFANGTKVVNATAFATTNMEFFNGSGGDVAKFIQQMALFPTPLTDAECQALTTL